MIGCGLMWLTSFTIVLSLFAFWYGMLGVLASYCSFCSLVCKCEMQRTDLWTVFACPSFLNVLIAYFNLLSQSHAVGFYLEDVQFDCWSRYCLDEASSGLPQSLQQSAGIVHRCANDHHHLPNPCHLIIYLCSYHQYCVIWDIGIVIK